MDEPACPGCRDLAQRVTELEARVAELTRLLDEATRAAKRQAAPFRKGPPKPDPKKPGRKPGDAHGTHGHRPPPTDPASECLHAPLPDACPHCSGSLIETGVADQFQTEIPRAPLVRQFTGRLESGLPPDSAPSVVCRHEYHGTEAIPERLDRSPVGEH
jgi:transposase